MAFGMFCALPNPVPVWDEAARPLMIVCFPLVGLLMGGLWALAAWLLGLAGLTGLLGAAILAVLPFLLTGFIHLDGYMDCCDAVLSRRDLPERQRILKDSHCGAFAVICLALLLLVQFAVLCDCDWQLCPLALVAIPMAPRCVTGLAVSVKKPMGTSQYAGAYRKQVRRGNVAALAAELALAVLLPPVFLGLRGIAPACAALAACLAVQFGARQLGGMSGDISGYGVSLGECAGLLALAVVMTLGGGV